MPAPPRNFIDHDPNARAVHLVNSQLVRRLFGNDGCLRALLFGEVDWIINVLYAHSTLDSAPVLRTSSTIHKGRLYDHTVERDTNVQSIDEIVPLATSVSGRCLLSGRSFWFGRSELSLRR